MLAAMLSSSVLAQTLARKGWQGSGLTVESWWQSAILYQINPLTFQDSKGNGFSDLRGITQRLDSLQSLGVDALVLSPLPLEAAGSERGLSTSTGQPFDTVYGTGEDLNELVQEASRRRIRVLVDLPFNSTFSGEETVNAARFWLSRGIAGLRLTDSNPQSIPLTAAQTSTRLTELEQLCMTYPGQRILFWDLPRDSAPASAPTPISRTRRRSASRRTAPSSEGNAVQSSSSKGPELILDGRLLQLNHWQAGDLRNLLANRPNTRFPLATSVLESEASGQTPSFDRLSDGAHRVEIARQVATLLLLGQAVPQLYAGQEIGMQSAAVSASATFEEHDESSLLNWYRRLSSLRQVKVALHGGSLQLLRLPETDVVAWLRRPPPGATGAAPVVVVCNVSPRAVIVSLSAALRTQGLPASGPLRTLASSSVSADPGTQGSFSGIALPAYGVYVGELRSQPGLESAPAPSRHRSSRGPSTSGE